MALPIQTDFVARLHRAVFPIAATAGFGQAVHYVWNAPPPRTWEDWPAGALVGFMLYLIVAMLAGLATSRRFWAEVAAYWRSGRAARIHLSGMIPAAVFVGWMIFIREADEPLVTNLLKWALMVAFWPAPVMLMIFLLLLPPH